VVGSSQYLKEGGNMGTPLTLQERLDKAAQAAEIVLWEILDEIEKD
jgi:hypothetical protein